VPGQIERNYRRRPLVAMADVVVFVCDSSPQAIPDTQRTFARLRASIKRRTEPVSLIVQANKQDVDGALSPAVLRRKLKLDSSVPMIAANAAKGDGVKGSSSISASGGTLLLNSGRGDSPVLSDVRLREAIAHAIDTKLLIQRVYDGHGQANTGLTDPRQPIYTGLDGPNYDPAMAKQLLDQAKADGYDGKITLTCGNTPSAQEQAVAIKGLLDAVGFDTTTELLSSADANQKILLQGNYQIGCGGVTVFAEGPVRGMNQFLSDSPRNRVGYKNPDMDKAIHDLYEAKDIPETTAAMKEAGEVWNATVPAVNLWSSEWFIGWKPKVHGIVMSREGEVMFQNAWIEH
jgi:peptide/nickel transport system substrate-binding protein